MYTEANIKERVYISLRKMKSRAKKLHEARKKNARRDEGGDAAEPQPSPKKKQKAMTATQRREETKRLAALAVKALEKKEKHTEFVFMFDTKMEEVTRRVESAGVGTTHTRASCPTWAARSYHMGTIVP